MKTGGGISPMLMGGSAMYQKNKPKTTTKQEEGLGTRIKKFGEKLDRSLMGKSPSGGRQGNTRQENISVGDYSMDITGPNAFRINKKTGSPAKQTKKPVAKKAPVKKEEGLGTRIKKFGEKLDRSLTGKSPSGGSQGNSRQESISVGDYSMDITGPNAFRINKKTGAKSPAKQMSKLKSGKSPAKQCFPTPEERRNNRLSGGREKKMQEKMPQTAAPGRPKPTTPKETPRSNPGKTPVRMKKC
jgi:hypothetical protein